MTDSEICRKCSKPKNSTSSGFVTRFINTCQCDFIQLDQEITISVCLICGKRINKREGSITQWIFGEGLCDCKRPEPVEKSVDSFIQPSFKGFSEIDEEELDLQPEKFPLERYKPVAELGKGTAGIVYLCRDRLLNKKVAVKTLLNLSGEQLVAFQHEARATAILNHPNIVKILDFGATESGNPFMVMEYVPGISLEKYLRKFGELENETAKFVFLQLAKALAYAHKRNILHRDLKPSNVILYETSDGIDVKLIDFGIAKVKESSGFVTTFQDKTLAGTPNYMSPDPTRGETFDSVSEVYCFGCVMYEALIGKPPFAGKTALDTLYMHANVEAPALSTINRSIDLQLQFIVAKCLSKQKSDRFKSMDELIEVQKQESTTDTIHFVKNNKSHFNFHNPLFIIMLVIGLFLAAGAIYRFVSFVGTGIDLRTVSNIDLGSAVHDQSTNSKLIKVTNGSKALKIYGIDNNTINISNYSAKRGKEILLKYPTLEGLEIENSDLEGQVIEYLSSLPLKAIRFSKCSINSDTIKILGKIPGLKFVSIDKSNLYAGSLSYIDKVSANLICIYDCGIDRQTISHLSRCKADIMLCLTLLGEPTNILSNMSNMKNLKYLIIWEEPFEGKKADLLASIPNLKKLTLHECALYPGSILKLNKLRKLESLFFTNDIEDRLDELASLSSLRELRLKHNSAVFSKCRYKPQLERLKIVSDSSVNQVNMLNFASLKTLKRLEFLNCPLIDQRFAKKFESLNSGCKVLISSSSKKEIEQSDLEKEMVDSIGIEKLNSYFSK